MAETMKKAPPVSRGLGDLVAFLSLDVTAGSVRQGAGAGRNIYVAGPTHREPTDAAVCALPESEGTREFEALISNPSFFQ